MTQLGQRRGAVGVAAREGRLLVIRRSQFVEAPGAYCFPGGAIEAGETEEAALVREFREELDVAALPLQRLWRSITSWDVELAWWHVAIAADAALAPHAREVESCHWLTPSEMLALPQLLESNRDFLAAGAAGAFAIRDVSF
ncbi:MAG: NUDIX domain-containing protein [Planctomycetes bacterium]|nr:NUDIX domain-containing protein [Planctomycetota bacterium]